MRMNRREILAGLGGSLAAAALRARAAATRAIGGPAFGTTWRIVLPDGVDVGAAVARVTAVIASVDAAMSPFRPASEISRFNAADTSDWQAMSTQSCAVARESIAIAEKSAGAFDPTVGPAVARYGFGPIRGQGSGVYQQIVVAEDGIRKLDPRLTIDFCGIAKGHAVDRMGTALARLGAHDWLIAFGGELLAHGGHPDGRPWQAGIERPMPGERAIQRIVRLDGQALATSGVAAHSYAVAGRRFSHIIDPHRGEPVDHDLASVSVLMPTACAADGFATALMALGPEAGPALAESAHISALFIRRRGGELEEIMTGAFADAVIA